MLVAVALAAFAVPAPARRSCRPGCRPGTAVQAAVQAPAAAKHASGAPCNVGIPVIGGVGQHDHQRRVQRRLARSRSGVGSIVSGVGNSILDAVASWLIGAATAITRFVAAQMTRDDDAGA